MKVLLISGKSGAGKDTFANFLREHLEAESKRVITIHFADCVKYYAKQYFGWTGAKNTEGRQLLQWLGTDVVRKKYPNYWADIVGQFLSAVNEQYDIALIPDLRFVNECKRVAKYNSDCVVIRINKLADDGTYILNPALTLEQCQHQSECDMDDYCCDIYINNGGTLNDLKQDAKDTLTTLNII